MKYKSRKQPCRALDLPDWNKKKEADKDIRAELVSYCAETGRARPIERFAAVTGLSKRTASIYVGGIFRHKIVRGSSTDYRRDLARFAILLECLDVPPEHALIRLIREKYDANFPYPVSSRAARSQETVSAHTNTIDGLVETENEYEVMLKLLPASDQQLVYQLIQRLYDASQKKSE